MRGCRVFSARGPVKECCISRRKELQARVKAVEHEKTRKRLRTDTEVYVFGSLVLLPPPVQKVIFRRGGGHGDGRSCAAVGRPVLTRHDVEGR